VEGRSALLALGPNPRIKVEFSLLSPLMSESPNRSDIARRVDKAEKLLQKGKTADALAEYLQILESDSQNDNVRQMAADLCLSLNKGAQAVKLMGELFERQVAAADATRASLTYKKLARYTNPSWEQKVRFGQLLENSNKKLAIGTYENALEDLRRQGKQEEGLLVLRRIASLDPSQANHLRVAEFSAELGEHVMASQSFLQLAELAETAGGNGEPVVRACLRGESGGFEDCRSLRQKPVGAGRGGSGDLYFRAAGSRPGSLG
jgi:tetratricopeptide (TPR) repeat protein